MSSNQLESKLPHLIWVCPDPLVGTLHAAQWLETTHELRKLDWRVTLVVIGPAGHRCIQGVDVLSIPIPPVYFLRQFVFHTKLLRLLASQWTMIDVILFHQMSAPWLLPLRLVRRLMGRQRPMVVMDTRTVFMIPMEVATWKERLRGPFSKWMSRLANHWADGQTAITQRMAKALCIPSHQLWGIWPSGVNLDQFIPAQIARRWPGTGEPIHLVYIGVLNYERNLMSLCRAVEQANAEGMAFILSLIGEGTERLDLEKFALQTGGRICVLPSVAHDQVPGLLAEAHIGVLPFPDEEKFQVSSPIKLFEYMAAGLPILATRIVCHTDVVGSGEYAFWAENANEEGLLAAMRLIWPTRTSLSRMGREAAIAATAWTWQESARKLKTALEHQGVRCQ